MAAGVDFLQIPEATGAAELDEYDADPEHHSEPHTRNRCNYAEYHQERE